MALALAIVELARLSSASAQPTVFSAGDTKKLEAGEVLTQFWKEKDGSGAGWAVGVIDAPPEKVFKVIADVARYKEFMTRMVESRVEGRRGERYRFFYKIDMPWPLADYWCVTENLHQLDPKQRVYARRWTLLSGTFQRNEGSWTVRPFGGERTLLTYSVILLPTTRAPGALVRYGTKVALPRSVLHFKERVAKLIRDKRL